MRKPAEPSGTVVPRPRARASHRGRRAKLTHDRDLIRPNLGHLGDRRRRLKGKPLDLFRTRGDGASHWEISGLSRYNVQCALLHRNLVQPALLTGTAGMPMSNDPTTATGDTQNVKTQSFRCRGIRNQRRAPYGRPPHIGECADFRVASRANPGKWQAAGRHDRRFQSDVVSGRDVQYASGI